MATLSRREPNLILKRQDKSKAANIQKPYQSKPNHIHLSQYDVTKIILLGNQWVKTSNSRNLSCLVTYQLRIIDFVSFSMGIHARKCRPYHTTTSNQLSIYFYNLITFSVQMAYALLRQRISSFLRSIKSLINLLSQSIWSRPSLSWLWTQGSATGMNFIFLGTWRSFSEQKQVEESSSHNDYFIISNLDRSSLQVSATIPADSLLPPITRSEAT